MISSISFLVTSSERKHIELANGKFTLVRTIKNRYTPSRSDASSKHFTAGEFVEYMKNRDPYITLDDGTKMRVYRGGDPNDVVIETICVIESHDEKQREVRSKKPLIIPPDFTDFLDW